MSLSITEELEAIRKKLSILEDPIKKRSLKARNWLEWPELQALRELSQLNHTFCYEECPDSRNICNKCYNQWRAIYVRGYS